MGLVIEPGAGHCVVQEACGASVLRALVLQGDFDDDNDPHADGKVKCEPKRNLQRDMEGGNAGWTTYYFGTADIWSSGTSPCKPVLINNDDSCSGPEIQCSRCYRACMVRKLFEQD